MATNLKTRAEAYVYIYDDLAGTPRGKRAAVPVLERDIQRVILDYLQARRIFAFRTNTGGALLAGHGGRGQFVRFGYKGVSDIIGITTDGRVSNMMTALQGMHSDKGCFCQRNPEKIGQFYHNNHSAQCYRVMEAEKECNATGRFLAIEVKGPKGKQSDEQAEFQKAVEAAGGIYCLARSLQDVIDCLEGK